MNISYVKDIGDLIQQVSASALATATAGGAGNNTQVTGSSIDRAAYGMPRSAQFAVAYETALTSAKTFGITAAKVEHSADNSAWTTFATLTAPGTLATGAGTVDGIVTFNVDLNSAYRYIRFDWTPSLSNTATDTVSQIAHVVLGGTTHLPPP